MKSINFTKVFFLSNEKKLLLIVGIAGIILAVMGFFPLGRPVGPLPI